MKKVKIQRPNERTRRLKAGDSCILLMACCFLILSAPTSVRSDAFEHQGLGARSMGMANAFVAVPGDYESIFWNPAGISKVDERTFHSEYRDLYGLGLLRYITAGYIHPNAGLGSVGFSWFRLDAIGEAGFLDYSENTLVISYATHFFDPLLLGVNGKYYRVNSSVGASGMGLDFGLTYELKRMPRPVIFGATVQDLTRTLISWDSGAKDRLPLRLRVGASSRIFAETLLSTQIGWEDQKNRSNHVGFEQGMFKRMIAMRFGATERDHLWRFSWGFGLRVRSFQLDYGWERQRLLGDTSTFSISFVF